MKKSLKSFLNSLLLGNKALLIVILLFVALSFLSPVFFTAKNLINIPRQATVSAILACGFAMVLGSGHIDLSVGSIVGFTGVVMAQLMVMGVPVALAILAGVAVGAVIGVINASIITAFRLPPFIVTLGTQQIIRGTIYLVTRQKPVTNLPASFAWIGQGSIGPIPTPIYILIGVAVIVWIITNRTSFGRYFLAMGGNPEAARVSGINTIAVRFGVFIAMGVCSALASVVMCARASSAQPTGGLNMEMDAISAVVIGGTSMAGGNANIVGAILGSLIVAMMNNGLNLLGVDSNWQYVVRGLLTLIAVVLDSITTMVLSRRMQQNAAKKFAQK